MNIRLWKWNDVTIWIGFKSKTQLPLIMIYKLWGDPKDPFIGKVIFNSMRL